MMYENIGHLLPPSLRKAWRGHMVCAGCRVPPDKALGFVVSASVLIGLAVMFSTPLQGAYALAVFVAAGALTAAVFIGVLRLKAERRAAAVEAVLPDVLQLMSTNLKAGMTLDKALLVSGKHKLGIIQDELARIGTNVGFGMSMHEALPELGTSVRSQKLAAVVRLLLSGLRSGGEISSLLDSLARNLRHQDIVEKKMRSAVSTYVTFIVIALAVVMPLLFALSTFLVTLLQDSAIGVAAPLEDYARVANPLSSTFLSMFAVVMLVTAAVMGSFLVGSIKEGKAVFGARYVIPLICSVLGVFFAVRYVLEVALLGLLT